jgi:alpha-ketoglutarate-dependent taurine dioxygenase
VNDTRATTVDGNTEHDSDDAPWATHRLDPFGLLISARTDGTDLRSYPPEKLRSLTREHRILVLRGFLNLSTAAELDAYARGFGTPMLWPFGTVLELVEHDDPADSVFSNGFLPFHWDGMYVSHIPEFQVFHCVTAPGTGDGGRTVFADTTRVLADATPEQRRAWQAITITYRIEQAAHYGGEVRSPLIVTHPTEPFLTIRFNEPMPDNGSVVNRSELHVNGLMDNEAKEALDVLRESLYDPRHHYRHQWSTGDVVIANNYVLLHTREPYRSRAPRHLRRVHVLGTPPFPNPAVV